MFDILLCIRDEHDLRLVGLAAAICLLSAMTAVLMLRQSRLTRGGAARGWIVAGGIAAGFGIWATHFIAMLGYDPGVVAGYDVRLTVGSLGIVLTTTIAGFLIAAARRTGPGLAVASAVAGAGFATMHYVGMAALEMPATIQWRVPYVALSVVLAIALLYPALSLALRGRTRLGGVGAGALLSLAVVGLHFTGMTAIELVPAQASIHSALLSPQAMSVLITAVSLLLLALCFAGSLVARRTRAAFAVREREMSALVRGITDCAIYMLDRRGRVANWNPGAQRLKGYSAEEAIGMPIRNFYTAEDRAADLPERVLATAAAGETYAGEGWRVRKDGSQFWAHTTLERIEDDAGAHLGFAKITRDMTAYKEDQDRIKEARSHLDAALEHMHHGLCLFDAQERLVLRNRRFAELWNLPEDSCPAGASLMEVATAALEARTGASAPHDRLENMRVLLEQSLADPDHPAIVSEFGEAFVVAICSRPLPGGGWVTTFEDITERRRSEAQIAHMAQHDALTGLANRGSFNAWLDREIEAAGTNAGRVAVVAIDLDRFKEINDSQGHAAGDLVLRKVGEALTATAGERETVARLGGDEFAVAKHFTDDAELLDFVARVDGAFEAQDGISVGASLGIAVYPSDATSREALLNNADLAMYRAKGSLGEHICYYEPGMDESARHRRQLASDLRHAIAGDELTVLYQPQRMLRTNEVSGYEALLRWNHPRFGAVPPTEFIPIAEETGEIVRLGEWVLRTACAEAACWARPDKVAVNLSPVQLLQVDLPEVITNILLETGLSPRRLELEITETAIIADKARALHSLRRIKSLGVSVAMDDFGTGYSSLDTLHSFPFDKIKIDKSFLLKAEENEQARAIIRAVLALGKSLRIPVLAEGVETEKQLDLLVGEGCDEAQGYYFGRPAPPPGAAERKLRIAAR